MSLRDLVRFAYGLLDFEVVGGPEWTANDRFDILAKVDKDTPIDQVRLMMRALLADRFKLTTRTEAREMLVLALVFADRNQKFGRRLQRSGAECREVLNVNGEPLALTPLAKRQGAPSTDPNAPPRCGGLYTAGHISAREVTMHQFARRLSQLLGSPVVDKTTLRGYFDADVDFSNEQTIVAPDLVAGIRPPDRDANRPSIYTALPEQLGLKLSSGREPVTVLVIDSADRPIPD